MGCGCTGFASSTGGGTPAAPTPIPTWFPCMAFTFADFTPFAALVGDVEKWSMPAKAMIMGAVIKTSVAFAGPGITGLTLSVGIVGSLAKVLSPFDAFAAVSNTNFGTAQTLDLEDFGAATSIRLAAVAVGANLSNLTAGAGCLYLLGAKIP
jgi:hypothetical protein